MQYIERFRLNRGGARALLRSSDVRAEMQRRADAIKVASESQWQEATAEVGGLDPVRVVADSSTGSGRAFATVIAIHPASLRIERQRRILGGAIDAARD